MFDSDPDYSAQGSYPVETGTILYSRSTKSTD